MRAVFVFVFFGTIGCAYLMNTPADNIEEVCIKYKGKDGYVCVRNKSDE
jgi:hypothetical protein